MDKSVSFLNCMSLILSSFKYFCYYYSIVHTMYSSVYFMFIYIFALRYVFESHFICRYFMKNIYFRSNKGKNEYTKSVELN
jgi:hypothetical protein